MHKRHTTTVVRKFYTDGRVENVKEKMTLEEMQDFVGGYIEEVPTLNKRLSLIINEEGLLNNLPYNYKATELVHPGTYVIGALQGDVLLVESGTL